MLKHRIKSIQLWQLWYWGSGAEENYFSQPQKEEIQSKHVPVYLFKKKIYRIKCICVITRQFDRETHWEINIHTFFFLCNFFLLSPVTVFGQVIMVTVRFGFAWAPNRMRMQDFVADSVHKERHLLTAVYLWTAQTHAVHAAVD